MKQQHIDPTCNTAIMKLHDALCSFTRATAKDYTLILVPHSPDEQVVMSLSGKQVPSDFDISPEEMLSKAMKIRTKG